MKTSENVQILHELKPCPFCGNPYPMITMNNYAGTWEISCPECDIRYRLGAGEKGRIRERIVHNWNRRAVT